MFLFILLSIFGDFIIYGLVGCKNVVGDKVFSIVKKVDNYCNNIKQY